MHQLTEAATARQRLAVWPKLRGSGEYRAEFDAGIAVAIVPVPASGAAPRAAPRAAPERDSGHMRQASDRAIM
ncbi:MAG: hypothetical protein JSW68_07095 [Burkholderiales bacterium]|nr:MAG: hypothetical protein JSW68_07095 [Burkholderiales bacterium]